MSAQPSWRLLWASDDRALYIDETGVYPPELSIAQTLDDVDEDDIEATSAYVYRFALDRCYLATEVDDDTGETRSYLVDVDPSRTDLPHAISQYRPWFAESLGDIARSVGCTAEDLTRDLCSDDPNALASAYDAIGGYHGFDNFDGYPQEWTEHEFAKWPDRGARLSTSERDEFTEGYISCALWCGVMAYKHDEDCPCADDPSDPDACTCEDTPELVSCDDERDASDLTDDARESLTRDAHDFYADHVADLRASTLTMEQCGHDFWLTRNRHGAGFWDRKHRGTEADAALDRLTDAAHAYGEQDFVVNPDGRIGEL